jgi:GntR family transcriptional regulator, galactonate operon transcriptional repressor
MIDAMKTTNHRDAVEAIAGWIVGDAERAGDTLPTESELCLRLGRSRTVIREAVKTLTAKGLLKAGPRVGTRVQPLDCWNHFDPDVIRWRFMGRADPTFIRDVIDLRLAIEPAAAEMAAERRVAAGIDLMVAAFADMESAIVTGRGWLAADLQFHSALIKASGNQLLAAMTPLISGILTVSFNHSVKSRSSARASLPLHAVVLEKVKAGDPDGARDAMTDLIRSARADILSDLDRDDFVMRSSTTLGTAA